MIRNEIAKDIEELILKYLRESKDFWVDLFPLIENSEYSYSDFYNILTVLIEENKIKIKDGNNISFLKLTKKGKLINEKELFFRIDKIEIKTKWFNQSWVGFLIALFSLLFAIYQGFQNKSLDNKVSFLNKEIDSLKNTSISHKSKLDSLNDKYISLEKKLSDLKIKTRQKK